MYISDHICCMLYEYLVYILFWSEKKKKKIPASAVYALGSSSSLFSEGSSSKFPRDCDKTYFLWHFIEDFFYIVDCYIRKPRCLKLQEKKRNGSHQMISR